MISSNICYLQSILFRNSGKWRWERIFFSFQRALYESPHTDENDVQTISHKCDVLSYTEYSAQRQSKGQTGSNESDVYYLAGTYEPTIGLIKIEEDVKMV